MATLEELFAFIERCDGYAHDNDNGGCSPSVVDSETPLILSPIEDHDAAAMTGETNTLRKASRRRRKRIGWSSSTGLQRRKRAELEFLRQHVVDLEAYLNQLKLPPPTYCNLIKDNTCIWTWKDAAIEQLVERLRSEEENRTLKAVVNNQLQVHDALRSILEDCSFGTADCQAQSC